MTTWMKTILITIVLVARANAFTTITTSTGVPVTVEQSLITQIKNQFNASVFVNPLAANTYQVKLFGLNPNYQSLPLVTLDTITNKLTSISTYTYVVGYAQGMLYERGKNSSSLGYFMGLCDNATNFNLTTIDTTTCNSVLGYMDNLITQQTDGIAIVPDPPVGF